MATVEVTIYGAGIFGLSCAWTLLQRGAKVRVIDPYGVAAGASGGIVGALAPHTPDNWNAKKEFQFESLVMAEAFWREVKNASGQSSGYCRSGRVQPVANARGLELAQGRRDQAKTLWRGAFDWQVVTSPGRWSLPSATGFFVADSLSAHLHPRRACRALAAAISASGGEISEGGDPEGMILWCTGWQGLEALSAEFEQPLGNGVKGQALLLAHDMSGAPQVFVDGVHVIPHLDGTTAIGSTSERAFDAPGSTDGQLDALLQKARQLVPALADAPVLRRWAGVRPRAKSRAPLLGPLPGRKGQFVANGGFKIGFGMAPKIAETMVDLILEDKDLIPDGFRFDPA